MTLIWEKVVVTAKDFLTTKNLNDSKEFNEPIFHAKLSSFNWDLQFASSSIFCEIVWKIAHKGGGTNEWNELDRLFCPGPVATYTNFRGNRTYKTGNQPEPGSIAVWKRGNSWQGHMGIVSEVSENKETFKIIEGRALIGSENRFIGVQESDNKKMNLPFANDKLNLLGFIYPKNEEIR